jgi:hypothetical protein
MLLQSLKEVLEPKIILKPLVHGVKSRFPFATYDIECNSADDWTFHNCGFFDGEIYTNHKSMESFLGSVLTKQYNGWRFFAHFGGRFDVHFVYDWLRANVPDMALEINCSGSAVIALTVRSGKNKWRFVDSYRLLPKSLLSLTYEFDVPHKKLQGLDFTDEKYNENDCRGLFEVLQIFFDEFDICSETIASHSLRVFRGHYLDRQIFQPARDVEDFVRMGYFGGRCEIYRYDEALVKNYDVNSLFPRAMQLPVPVHYIGETQDVPDADDKIGFFRANIKYPDCYLPILPVRVDKLYFPVGSFEGIFSSMELLEADRAGADIEILEGRLFHAEPLLKDFIDRLYIMKKEADAAGNGAKRYIAKILMNSHYGKYGQRRLQRSYCTDDGREGLFPLPGGLAYYMMESRAAHILPHISATITARARLIQHDLLTKADQWYTDTDSLFTTGDYPTGPHIGELHYEGEGIFKAYRLKEYYFDGAYKIKGLQRSRADTKEEREAADKALAEMYLANEKTVNNGMAGWAESVRYGYHTVRRVDRVKMRGEVRDKRARCGIHTRPWNVAELINQSLKRTIALDPAKSIVEAIKANGYISPERIRKAGTWAEWAALPIGLRLQIFRKKSKNSPDTLASLLAGDGYAWIETEVDLLKALQANPYFGLEAAGGESPGHVRELSDTTEGDILGDVPF